MWLIFIVQKKFHFGENPLETNDSNMIYDIKQFSFDTIFEFVKC